MEFIFFQSVTEQLVQIFIKMINVSPSITQNISSRFKENIFFNVFDLFVFCTDVNNSTETKKKKIPQIKKKLKTKKKKLRLK